VFLILGIVDRTKAELQAIAKKIVDASKKTAHYETGYLFRSIYGVVDERGKLEFGEVFYGQFYDNSDLQENIKKMLPSDVPYSLIWTDEDGNPYEAIRKTASGRLVENKVTPKIAKKNLSIGGIKNFLKGVKDGEKKNTEADNSGSNN